MKKRPDPQGKGPYKTTEGIHTSDSHSSSPKGSSNIYPYNQIEERGYPKILRAVGHRIQVDIVRRGQWELDNEWNLSQSLIHNGSTESADPPGGHFLNP